MLAAALAPLGAGALAAPAGAAAPLLLDPAPGCGPALDSDSPLDCQPPQLASFGGWLAWSRATSAGAFELMLRSPAGATAPAPIAPRPAPFDVQLGPEGHGVVAVYSRCADAIRYLGCTLHELALGVPGASERTLSPPGGGSLHEPAIWNGRLVFLRRNRAGGGENPLHAMGRQPDGLLAWRLGSSHTQSLTLPVSRGTREWPRGVTGVVTGLTLHEGWLAYVTSSGISSSSFELGLRTLWAQQLGQGPRLIDQITAGEGNVCDPSLLSPALAAGWVYAYVHPCDPSGRDLDRWTRYGLSAHSAQSARYAFTHSGEDVIYAVVPDGHGVDWEGGEVLRLESVAWRTVARPAPQSFCSRDDLFC
jgi:hypothetical protein